MSKSGRPFDLRPESPISLISHNAPSLAALMHRGVHFKKMTTKRSKAAPSVAVATLARALKVNLQLIPAIPISTYTYIIFPVCIDYNWNIISNSTLHQILLFLMNFRNILLLSHLTHQTLHFVAANQRISKGSRCSNISCRCPLVNSRQSPVQEKSSNKH